MTLYKISEIADIFVGRDLVEKSFSEFQTRTHKYPIYSNSVTNKGLYGYYDFEEYSANCVTVVGRGVGLGYAFPRTEGFGAIGRLIVLKPKKGLFDVRYLADYINHQVKFYSESSGIPQLPGEAISKYSVILPPLSEQKAIADLLSIWDKAIEKTERLIAAKEMALEAYGRELFDRKYDGRRKGWQVVKLKTVFVEHGDSSTGKEEVFSVSVHKGLVNQIEHLGRSFSAENTDHYNRVHYGDVVYTKSPTGDFPLGIVKQSAIKDDVIVSPLYGVFTPVTLELGTVVDFYFSSPSRTRNYLAPIVQKGAKNTIAITSTTFLSNTMNLPIEHEVQKRVAEFVKTAREEIRVLRDIAAKYKEQKRGLMQKLLTGEWRVKGM